MVLALWKKCEDSIVSKYLATSFLSIITVLYYIAIINYPLSIHYYWIKSIPSSDFRSFYLMSFFCLGSHPELYLILRLFLVVTISQTVLIYDDLDSLRTIGQILCRMSSRGIFMMFFSWLDWSCTFWRRRLHRIMSRGHIINMTHHCWCWPWWSGWGSACQISQL